MVVKTQKKVGFNNNNNMEAKMTHNLQTQTFNFDGKTFKKVLIHTTFLMLCLLLSDQKKH